MRIPISVAILGVVGLVGAGAFGVWKLSELRPAPAPELAMAHDMVGQWRPPGLTCADAVTIAFESGNLTLDYGSASEDDVQAVAGLEPNGFIRTYSAQRGSRFYLLEGDTLIMHAAEGQTARLERCDADAPAVTFATAQEAAPVPPPPLASPAAAPQLAAAPAPASPAPASPPAASPRPTPPPSARAAPTVADNVAREEAPPPAPLTLLAAAPASTPEPLAAPAPPPPPITQPVWLARPTAAEVAIFYPERALVREQPGSARLDCVVQQDGRLACSVQAEAPAGYGFGEAALGIAQSFRMAPNLADGSATEGRRILVPISFTQN